MFPPASSDAQGGTHRRIEGRQLKQQNHPVHSRKAYLMLCIDALIRIGEALPLPRLLTSCQTRPRSSILSPSLLSSTQVHQENTHWQGSMAGWRGGLCKAQRCLWQEADRCCALSSCCYSCLYPTRPCSSAKKGISASELLTERGGS